MGILIVDDSESSRMLMEVILRKTGYHQLLTAASARDAFTRLGMDGPATPDMDIDLVLLDIMMPEVDGIEACRRINAVESLRDIPIIMVSARADTKYLEAAFNAGAHDYITKPFNTLEVTARVRSALALKRETDSRIHAHAELQEKKRILANESLAKSQILKTATHDLKTPLTGIIGYADRLLGQRANVGLLSERQQKYVEAISECSHQMAFMIDRLLDVPRIEAGNLDMTPICLEVREEIERTIQNLQTRFQEKRINVLLDVPHSLRPVYADQDRFTQIIKILLTNACEYSHDEALVTVSANETPGFVQIDVTDSGIGIPESSQEKLFTKFFRGGDTVSQTGSGAGLGLFIAKHLLEAQGGEIWACSEEGVGSTFSITLPCADSENFKSITPIEPATATMV